MIAQLALLAVGGVAASVTLAAVPPTWLAAAFGLLLPIYGVSGIPPSVWDVTRLALAAAIIVQIRADVHPALLYPWMIPLWVIGLLVAADGATTQSASLSTGAAILLSSTIAAQMARRDTIARVIVGGYVVGCMVSAAVLLLQAMGFATIAVATTLSYGRFAGLGSAAPRTSVELALACCYLFVYAKRASTAGRQLAYVAGAIICASALLASGGRTGLAGLGLAIAVAVFRGALKLWATLAVTVTTWGVIAGAQHINLPLSTVLRLTQDQSGAAGTYDLSDGRSELFSDALAALTEHPLLGPGYGEFDRTYGLMPHASVLSFAVSGGIIALIAGLYLLAKMTRAAVRRPGPLAPALVVAVLVPFALLEPDGPFVSISFLTLLAIAAMETTKARQGVGNDRSATRSSVAA